MRENKARISDFHWKINSDTGSVQATNFPFQCYPRRETEMEMLQIQLKMVVEMTMQKTNWSTVCHFHLHLSSILTITYYLHGQKRAESRCKKTEQTRTTLQATIFLHLLAHMRREGVKNGGHNVNIVSVRRCTDTRLSAVYSLVLPANRSNEIFINNPRVVRYVVCRRYSTVHPPRERESYISGQSSSAYLFLFGIRPDQTGGARVFFVCSHERERTTFFASNIKNAPKKVDFNRKHFNFSFIRLTVFV